MKTTSFFASLCAASALVSVAEAQTNVYVTGSTAFRESAHAAIRAKMATGYTFAYTGSDINTAAQAVFKGTIGTDAVNVYTSWSGSVAGIKALAVTGTYANAVRPKFLAASQATSVSPGTGSAATGTDAQVADIAFADNLQASTPFRASTASGNVALNETQVGIVPFKFVTSYSVAGFPNKLTNMTPQLAQALYSNGTMPVAMFTGDAADQGTFVFATGRDPDSGTRVITLAETAYGALIPVNQFKPTIPASPGFTVTAHAPFPAKAIDPATGVGLPLGWAEGNNGQGGTAVADSLRYLTTAAGVNGFYVAGLGLLDADRAITGTGSATPSGTGNAKELTWNGVAYSYANITQGKYTFWGYEYIDVRASLPATDVRRKTATAISDYLINLPATAPAIQETSPTLNLNDMSVIRSGDGGLVAPIYL